MGLLAWITLLPLFGAALVMLVPREEEAIHRGIGLLTAIVTFVVSLLILPDFDAAQAGFQLEVDKVWIAPLGIRFHLGIDGISLWLVLLTTFMMPLTLLSPQAIGIRNIRVREFIVAMLVLETGMIGAFVALDLFVFYVFWELMLIPMYFIIGIWGGERRLYAAIKFVIYTLVGSLLMLVAILYLYAQCHAATGTYSFDYTSLSHLTLPYRPQLLCFAAFALAFAIKVPMFPLHTWLPDAHVEAPTGGSVILAAVLLKFGTYGFIRFAMPMFPLAAAGRPRRCIAILAVIGIIYGALMAYVQDDAKKLVAYSSVSHLGFVVLGILTLNPQGVQGALYQMLAHGIATGGLFLAVGVLYDRRHTRRLRRLRRAVEADADLRGLLPGDRAGLGRPARAVRLRRRVPGADRHVHRDKTWATVGMTGYFPAPKLIGALSATAVILARDVPADDVPEAVVRAARQAREQGRARPPRARDLGVRHRRRRRAGDGRLMPQPILRARRRRCSAFIDGLPRSIAGGAPRAGCARRTSTRRCRPPRPPAAPAAGTRSRGGSAAAVAREEGCVQ